MGPDISYGSVHTGLKQGQELAPLPPIVPVPFPVPVQVPVLRLKIMTLWLETSLKMIGAQLRKLTN